MNWKRNFWVMKTHIGMCGWILLLISLSVLPGSLFAQKPVDPISPNSNKSPQDTSVQEALNLHRQVAARQSLDQNKVIPGLIPTFFERESPKGSPYLSPNWMIGLIETTYHKTIPANNEVIYFNYNKMKGQIIAIHKDNEVLNIPNESVVRFTLVDSNRIYEFEKVPEVSDDFYLMPVTKTEKGYSLYRRVITRMVPANYRSEGYYTTGEKHDVYEDFFEYYFVYPDKSTYRKFFLKENAIRNVFKDFPDQFNDFIYSKNSATTEKNLILMIESINAGSIKRAG